MFGYKRPNSSELISTVKQSTARQSFQKAYDDAPSNFGSKRMRSLEDITETVIF